MCILAPILIMDTLMWGPGLLYFCTSSTRCSQTCLDAQVAPQCTPTAPCSALHTSTTQVCTSIALHSTLQFNQTDCSAIRSYDWVQCNAVLVQFSSIWPANAAKLGAVLEIRAEVASHSRSRKHMDQAH